MRKKLTIAVFVLSVLIIVSVTAIRAGMMGGMMEGGGMMGGMMSQMAWYGGAAVPIDWKTPRPPENERSIELGNRIYQNRCVPCHGSKGDGAGQIAAELEVKPRDFTSGTFKFRSTPTGYPPTNEDMFTTVSRGLHGTAMLPWTQLSTVEKWYVVYFIKTFSDVFEEDDDKVVVKPPKPDKSETEYIALGKQTYKKAKCAQCHGARGYGDGEKADKLKDDWHNPIRPRNFVGELLKRGMEVNDIYLTIATGLYGSPMEGYQDKLSKDEIMSLAYYIRSIALKKRPRRGMMGMMSSMTSDEMVGMRIYHHGG